LLKGACVGPEGSPPLRVFPRLTLLLSFLTFFPLLWSTSNPLTPSPFMQQALKGISPLFISPFQWDPPLVLGRFFRAALVRLSRSPFFWISRRASFGFFLEFFPAFSLLQFRSPYSTRADLLLYLRPYGSSTPPAALFSVVTLIGACDPCSSTLLLIGSSPDYYYAFEVVRFVSSDRTWGSHSGNGLSLLWHYKDLGAGLPSPSP